MRYSTALDVFPGLRCRERVISTGVRMAGLLDLTPFARVSDVDAAVRFIASVLGFQTRFVRDGLSTLLLDDCQSPSCIAFGQQQCVVVYQALMIIFGQPIPEKS